MLITIPDELCQLISDRCGYTLTPTGVQDAVLRTLKKSINYDLDKECTTFTGEQIFLLRHIFGSFKDAEDLLSRIKRLGNVKVQGKEYILTAEQMKRLRQEAFFHCNPGEPRSETECKTLEQKEKIVSRYVIRQIDYFMKQMCSQI